MQPSSSTDSFDTLYHHRTERNPRFQRSSLKPQARRPPADKASELRADFSQFFKKYPTRSSIISEDEITLRSPETPETSSLSSATIDNNKDASSNNPNPLKMRQNEVYQAALDSISDLKTRTILSHLYKEKQQGDEEKQCLSNYINYLHNLFPTSSTNRAICALGPSLNHLQDITESEVFSIGLNEDFQLGLGKTVRYQPFTSKFRKVDLCDKIDHVLERIQIVKLACSSLHTLALDQDGKLYSWGLAELIGRDAESEESPALVTFPNTRVRIVSMAAGEFVSICVDQRGSVYTFGGFRNSRGEKLGYHKKPVLCVGLKNAICQVAASESMVAALDEFGSLFTWGNCEFGEGGRPPLFSETPLRVFTDHPISKIWAFGFSLFFVSDQKLYACGKNGFGELGLGHSNSTYYPELISLLPDTVVQSIAGGIHHTLLLTDEGKVYGCGKNVDGQLGLGSNVHFTMSFQLVLGSFQYPVLYIAAGTSSHHSYVIDSKSNLFTSGQNQYGQLGHGDEDCIFQFTKVNLKGRQCFSVVGGSQFSILSLSQRETSDHN